jgi:hypothetical protein
VNQPPGKRATPSFSTQSGITRQRPSKPPAHGHLAGKATKEKIHSLSALGQAAIGRGYCEKHDAKFAIIACYALARKQQRETAAPAVVEACMSDIPPPLQTPRRRARGRPFDKGRSGNPAGRPAGSRNKATLAG